MSLSLEFRVRSISPIPLEGFSLKFGHMFASVIQYAELINQPGWHKVKVTVQGHMFEPWISCPLCISYTSGRIFFKLWSNVHLSETMCRIKNSTIPTQAQGHSSRSWVWALNFVSALYLLYPWEDFLWTLVKCSTVGRCAEPITQSWGLKDKVTVQGREFEPWISCPFDISFTPGRIFF